MCLIIYSPTGKIPQEHLTNGLSNNPDGWGFMVASRQKVLHFFKGMREVDFWPTWKKRPAGPVVWHARIGTHGSKGLDNCHPFSLAPYHPGWGMAHNGIIPSMPESKSKSDTRMFIDIVINELPKGFLRNPGIYQMLGLSIGYSKLVFMNGRGEVEIINDSLGKWINGRWYSNTSHEKKKADTLFQSARFHKQGNSSLPSCLFDGLDESDRRVPAYYTRMVKKEALAGESK